MLEDIASSRFGLWIVATIIVAIDSAFFLKPGKFAFSVSRRNRVRLRISPSPFMVRNKELACSLLSFPFQLFFISRIDALEGTAPETFSALSHLRRMSRQNEIFSALSVATAILLFMGPSIAAIRGIQTSIIFLFPPLYVLAITTSVLLWRRRGRFSFSDSMVLRISLEIVLCPVLLVNISKRISLAQTSELNTYRLALLSSSPEQTIATVRENLKFHTGD